jgi:clan AA aspartic protease (TIGR02281 family)
MFQIVLTLIAGVLIGWYFHIYFMALNPKGTKETMLLSKVDVKRCEPTTVVVNQYDKRDIIKENNISNKINKEIENEILFERLLRDGNFSDAMSLYLEANETKLKEYRPIIVLYFNDMCKKSPKKCIEQILQYIDIEPKAIDGDLNMIIESYIKQLKATKDFKNIILFLEEIINKNVDTQKYIIRLAKIYYELDDYEKAETILEDIDSDSTYSAKVNTILADIEKKRKELEEYPHKIELNKIGSQFSINILIDNAPLTLLLDTGASYTLIDEDIVPTLNIQREIILNTAGGEITAYLATANTLTLDDIELTDFSLTVAPFKEKGFDGLLGMNFFEKFKFKIDQNRSLLYLKLK